MYLSFLPSAWQRGLWWVAVRYLPDIYQLLPVLTKKWLYSYRTVNYSNRAVNNYSNRAVNNYSNRTVNNYSNRQSNELSHSFIDVAICWTPYHKLHLIDSLRTCHTFLYCRNALCCNNFCALCIIYFWNRF